MAAQQGVVEEIVDGDMLWVRINEPGGSLPRGGPHEIRLLGIDAPEIDHPDREVECHGPEATEFTASTLPIDATVWLLADEEDSDSEGRFLRYIWTADGVFFNQEAVRQGHARTEPFEPNDRYIEELRAAEAEAKADNRGMWGPPCDYDAPPPPPPPEPEPAPPPPPPTEQSDCHPSYEGACVPIASDVDCAGGSGDGPAYVRGPVRVVGPDVYDLDRDKDGVACEN